MLRNRTAHAAGDSREARATDVPASGVRPVDRRAVIATPTQPPIFDEPRARLDSIDETSVKLPNPVLLAIARGEPRTPPRRLTWFAAGLAAGALVTSLVTGDTRGRAAHVRAWAGEIVTSLVHARPASDAQRDGASPP